MFLNHFYKYIVSRPDWRIFPPYSLFFRIFAYISSNLFYESLVKTQYASFEEINDIQEKRLLRLLVNAKKKVPFYVVYLNSVKSISDFYKLVPLSKQILKVEFDNGTIFDRRLMKYGDLHHTSGSTGIPLYYYRDKNMLARKYAIHKRALVWAGMTTKDRVVNIFPFNFIPKIFEFSDRNSLFIQCKEPQWIDDNWKMLQSAFGHKSIILRSRVSELVRIAQILEQKHEKYNFKSIISQSEQITPETRLYLTRIFGAPVFNNYGSSEALTIAQECEMHEGLHINSEYVKLEILDVQNNPLSPGESGNIVVTSFDNEVMPIIRYQIGDVGRWYDSPCRCGRTLPRIELEGRGAYFFALPNGKIGYLYALINPINFLINKILEHQVIRVTRFHFVVKIVPSRFFSGADKKFIVDNFLSYLGKEAKVSLELVDSIEKGESRKLRSFLNLSDDLPFAEKIK